MFSFQAAFRSNNLVIYHIPAHSLPVKVIGKTSKAALNTLFNTRHHQQTQNSSTLGQPCPLGPSEKLGFRRRPCRGTVFQMSQDLKYTRVWKLMGPERIEGEGVLAEHPWPVQPDNPQISLLEDLGVKPSRRCCNMNSCPTQEVPRDQKLRAEQTGSDHTTCHGPNLLFISHEPHRNVVYLWSLLSPDLVAISTGSQNWRRSLVQTVPPSRLSSSARLNTWHAHAFGREEQIKWKNISGFFQLIV